MQISLKDSGEGGWQRPVRADNGSGHAGQRRELAWADGGGGWPLGAGQRPGEAPSQSGLAAAPREVIGRAWSGDGQSWPRRHQAGRQEEPAGGGTSRGGWPLERQAEPAE
jgi:hypothetical protein